MTVLSTTELEKLLAEDAPYGDLTTEALGIGRSKGLIQFTARSAMTVAAIEEARALIGLTGIEARLETRSGETVGAGTILLIAEGPADALLRA